MKVLMFGWEYPPHVFGGLATANFGITQGLHAQGDVDITLCLPHPFGDEDRSACKFVAMNSVPIAWRDVNRDYVQQRVGGKVNPTVYAIEKDGMDNADCIMCVSELTRQTVINQYHQDPRKCFAMHNAVYPLKQEWQDIPRPDHKGKEKVVTFLGRLTMQKGPEYFVEAANMVLHRTRNVRFCMAGSGDMMDQMIYLAAERGIADRFHFPGFMRGKQVYECLKDSDVYVMPSVSEPFGISPLEAMQCGTPTIISKQSGCGEILTNCIKVDYWDIHALADAIYSICHNESLFDYLSEEGRKEVDQITWEKVGARIKDLYLKTLGWK